MSKPHAPERVQIETESRENLFIVNYPGVIKFEIRKLNLTKDIETLHEWFSSDRGHFWGLQDKSLAEVEEIYANVLKKEGYEVFMGIQSTTGNPAFLLECYQPTKDILGSYYDAKETDRSRHLFVAPPTKKIENFTWYVFVALLEFIFHDPLVQRTVGEPDIRNTKVLARNLQLGHEFGKVIFLPHKTAQLTYLTRDGFNQAKQAIALPLKRHPIHPLKLKYYVLAGRIRRKLIRVLRRK